MPTYSFEFIVEDLDLDDDAALAELFEVFDPQDDPIALWSSLGLTGISFTASGPDPETVLHDTLQRLRTGLPEVTVTRLSRSWVTVGELAEKLGWDRKSFLQKAVTADIPAPNHVLDGGVAVWDLAALTRWLDGALFAGEPEPIPTEVALRFDLELRSGHTG